MCTFEPTIEVLNQTELCYKDLMIKLSNDRSAFLTKNGIIRTDSKQKSCNSGMEDKFKTMDDHIRIVRIIDIKNNVNGIFLANVSGDAIKITNNDFKNFAESFIDNELILKITSHKYFRLFRDSFFIVLVCVFIVVLLVYSCNHKEDASRILNLISGFFFNIKRNDAQQITVTNEMEMIKNRQLEHEKQNMIIMDNLVKIANSKQMQLRESNSNFCDACDRNFSSEYHYKAHINSSKCLKKIKYDV
jgi:hypothetical protein